MQQQRDKNSSIRTPQQDMMNSSYKYQTDQDLKSIDYRPEELFQGEESYVRSVTNMDTSFTNAKYRESEPLRQDDTDNKTIACEEGNQRWTIVNECDTGKDLYTSSPSPILLEQ